jgi:hypothetical protein
MIDQTTTPTATADGKTEERVQDRETKSLNEPHLSIGERHVALHRSNQERDHLSVDERENVKDGERTDHVPSATRRRIHAVDSAARAAERVHCFR